MLRNVRPFLIVKGEQADLYIRFAGTMVYHHYGGNRKLPDHVARDRDEMILDMTALRGRRRAS
jgi:hypothetical protein